MKQYLQRAERGRGTPREGISSTRHFMTTKFVPGRKDAAAGAERSLYRLGTDYIDLNLAHWSRDLSPPRFEST